MKRITLTDEQAEALAATAECEAESLLSWAAGASEVMPDGESSEQVLQARSRAAELLIIVRLLRL